MTLVLPGYDQQFPSFYAIKMFHYSLTQWTHIGLQAAHLKFWIHFIIWQLVEKFLYIEFEKKENLQFIKEWIERFFMLTQLFCIGPPLTIILCLIKCFHANIFLHKHSNDIYYFMILQFDVLSLRHNHPFA